MSIKNIFKPAVLAAAVSLALVACNDDNAPAANNIAFNGAVVDGLVDGGNIFAVDAAGLAEVLEGTDPADVALGEAVPAGGFFTLEIEEGEVSFPLAFIFDSTGATDGDENVIDMVGFLFAQPGDDEQIVITPQSSMVGTTALALAGGDPAAVTQENVEQAIALLPDVFGAGLDADFLDGVVPADADLEAIVASTEAAADAFFAALAATGVESANELQVLFGADLANDGLLDGIVPEGFDADMALAGAQGVFDSIEDGDFRNPAQTAGEQVLLADGLTASYVTRETGQDLDMFAFWPHGSQTPTHLIACIEEGLFLIDDANENGELDFADGDRAIPSVQTIGIAADNFGEVTTILRGMDRCDGIRTTPWGTVLATEETDDGAGYEIIDPLNIVNHQVVTRGGAGEAATIIDDEGNTSTNVVKQTALPTMSWEGLTVLETGVVIGGDELRPGTAADDVDGGAIFKFIPETLFDGGEAITDLAQSPFATGSVYAFQASCFGGAAQFGQGCEIGNGSWVEVGAATAREDANANGATGFYRPEDLHMDPTYEAPEDFPNAVRFYWTNTGNEGGHNFAETLVAVDLDPADVGTAEAPTFNTTINRFVEGWGDGDSGNTNAFTSHDNLAINPVNGIVYVIEDHRNGDVFACLPDSADRDIKTDGCVRILSVEDTSAEPTGFIISPDGSQAYVSIQHSSDGNMPLVDGFRTDDFIVIDGLQAVDADAVANFGIERDQLLHDNSETFFGFEGPLAASSEADVTREDTFESAGEGLPVTGDTNFGVDASEQIELADGLTATYLTRIAGQDTDMIAFWPHGVQNPTHAITCVEEGLFLIDDLNGNGVLDFADGDRAIPSVQRVDLATGEVETILRGMDRCDGIRSTAWGTILATEETADGFAFEILEPLATTEHQVVDRGFIGQDATIIDQAGNASEVVVKRNALPTMRWEGLTVLDSGVVIGGDELRPGDADINGLDQFHENFQEAIADSDGGAMFKFVPESPFEGGAAITDLADSPLAAGSTWALQVSCRDDRQQFGQGCEIGNGAWIGVRATRAAADANERGATGFYRPEDLHMDPVYAGEGVRFCWANTGNEGASNFGEVICGVDSAPLEADADTRSVVINRFVEGDEEFNSVDNLAFQPGTGILYVIEDHRNGDVWACLPDGPDADIKTDGCVRVLSVIDQSAEPTGFTFDPTGTVAYVNIQHTSESGNADLNFDGFRTDDMIKIEGFTAPADVTGVTPDGLTFGEYVEADLRDNSAALFGVGAPLANDAGEE